jgi:para-nitrobenzyl esterase
MIKLCIKSIFTMNQTLVVLLVTACAAGWGVAQQPAPVKVENGVAQGLSEDGLTVYRGIPFAAPPVGDLRWRPPQRAATLELGRTLEKQCDML